MKSVSVQLYGFAKWTGKESFVLLHGPVPECLRLVHGKALPVPKGWNSCFPTWEPWVTIAKNFQFLKVGTDGSQRGNQRLPWQGTAGSETLKLTVPNLGTRGYHLLQGIAGSQTLEYMSSKLGGYHCKAAGSQSLKLMVPNLKK